MIGQPVSTAGSGGRIQPARPGDPSRIGPYRIVGRLGEGGMGTVHAGVAPDGGRVAVKVVHRAQAGDPEFRARFRREVRLSARVQGPSLLPLLAADPDADAPWLATPYVPGPTLAQHLAAYGPLSGGTLYAFATGTAQALAAIHAAGVVHRDVKPQNVLLTPAGPRVLDFGIAHATDGTSVTRTGMLTGTPGWLSPEHYRSGLAGPESDLFTWGALVAYAATGRLPFGGGAPEAVAYRVTSGEPDLDGTPERLREILERALVKEPTERSTAVEAAEGCARLLAAEPTQVLGGSKEAEEGLDPTLVGELVTARWSVPDVEDPTWPEPLRAPGSSSRRRAAAVVLAAAAVVGAGVGGAWSFHGNGDGSPAARNAATAVPTTARAGAATSSTAAGGITVRESDGVSGAEGTPSGPATVADAGAVAASDAQASTDVAASASASAAAATLATQQHAALAHTYNVGHFTVKFTEVDVGDGEPQTYVLARVTSHSSDTAIYEQRGIIVSLIKPSGALDVRTTLCVELAGNTYGDYEGSQDSGSPDWSSIRVSLSKETPC
ncbi:serine/threonine-protein kinase [Streptomyces mirabilis]